MPEGWNPAIMTMSKHAGSTVLTMPGKASKLKSAPRNRFRDFSRPKSADQVFSGLRLTLAGCLPALKANSLETTGTP